MKFIRKVFQKEKTSEIKTDFVKLSENNYFVSVDECLINFAKEMHKQYLEKLSRNEEHTNTISNKQCPS